jgi:hypothetical protein
VSPLQGADSLMGMLEAHETATQRSAERIADAGTDRLERNIKRRTPVDTSPFRHKPERPRGALKDSVHRTEGLVTKQVRARLRTITGEVISDDPIWIWVEEDTLPHTIRARVPGERLRFQSANGFVGADGTDYPAGTWVEVDEVEHPGTKGQHMMTLGALDTEAQTEEIARDPVGRWRHEVESVHT